MIVAQIFQMDQKIDDEAPLRHFGVIEVFGRSYFLGTMSLILKIVITHEL